MEILLHIIIIIKELLITAAPFFHCKHALLWANYLICINHVERLITLQNHVASSGLYKVFVILGG